MNRHDKEDSVDEVGSQMNAPQNKFYSNTLAVESDVNPRNGDHDYEAREFYQSSRRNENKYSSM